MWNRFGKVLLNKKAVDYLERTERPNLDFAYRIAGGDELETIEFCRRLPIIQNRPDLVHHYKNSSEVQSSVKRLGFDVFFSTLKNSSQN